jgi:hypothetical protein
MAATPQPSRPSPNGETTAYQLATEKLPAAVREQLYRQLTQAKIPENDPLWAIVGVQAGILEPFVTNQPHVDALTKALATIERAADRIDKRSQYLNLGWPIAAVAMAFGLSWIVRGWWDGRQEAQKEEARARTAEYELAQDLKDIGWELTCRLDNDGYAVIATVKSTNPNSRWRVIQATRAPDDKAAQIILACPPPTPAVIQPLDPSPKPHKTR